MLKAGGVKALAVVGRSPGCVAWHRWRAAAAAMGNAVGHALAVLRTDFDDS